MKESTKDNIRFALFIFALWLAVWLTSCTSTYQGPPLTFSASYTQDGASIGGSIRLDPSFAKQKK